MYIYIYTRTYNVCATDIYTYIYTYIYIYVYIYIYIYIGLTRREDRDPSSSRTHNPSVLFGIALSYLAPWLCQCVLVDNKISFNIYA